MSHWWKSKTYIAYNTNGFTLSSQTETKTCNLNKWHNFLTAFHCTAKSGRQIIRQVVQVWIFNTRWGCPVPHPDGLEHLQGWGTQQLSGQLGLSRGHSTISYEHKHSSSEDAGRSNFTCVRVILANNSWSFISAFTGLTVYWSAFLGRVIDLFFHSSSQHNFIFVFSSGFPNYALFCCCFSLCVVLSTFLQL